MASPKRVTIRHLRSFVVVAQQRSITKASRLLFVTQSALSLTIQHLEEDLDVRLLERTTRRVELTEAGMELLASAEKLVRDFDAIVKDVQEFETRKRSSVRVAALPSAMGALLPIIAASYLEDFPNVELSLREDTRRGVQGRVLRGHADFGVSSVWQSHPDLEFEPLLYDSYGVVLPPLHALAKRPGLLQWVELRRLPIISFGMDASTLEQIAVLPEIAQKLRRPQHMVADSSAVESFVRAGLGVAVMTALSARRPPLSTLPFRLMDDPSCHRIIGLLFLRGKPPSPSAQALMDSVRQAARSITGTSGSVSPGS